jgi:cysteine desulfurase/selenocysteine lyase
VKKSFFLNYGATAPIRTSTATFMSDLCQEMSLPLGARFYTSLSLIEQTRRRIADLIGAFPKEIAFFNNTSTALSMLALALPFKKGDVVLAASDEFSSNRFVWQNLSSKGVIFRTFEIKKNQSLIQTLSEIDLREVKLISLSAISYCTGRFYELEAFCSFCKNHGIWSCLDAIQAVGAVAIDCHNLDIDFLVGGGQKWLLGPIGCGYLYAKQEWHERLFTPLVGWTSAKYPERHEIERLDFCDELARFEPGLPNFLSIAGLGHSLETLEKTGWPFIFEEIQKRTHYVKENLSKLGYELLSSSKLGGIVSTEIPKGILPRLALEHFEKQNIQLTVRNFIRVSPHYDTPFEDLNIFLQAAAELKKISFPKWSQSYTSAQKDPKTQTVKTAWLVGATGTLGEALAHNLSAQGYRLKLFARNLLEIEDLAKKLPKDCDLSYQSVDLASYEEAYSLSKSLIDSGPVDLMIVACIGNLSARFDQVEPRIFHQMGILSGIGLLLGSFEKKATPAAQVVGLTSLQSRFSIPYMSYSHALHLGFSELLNSFEVESGFWTQLVVARSCHSNLQKQIGRVLLRYMKTSGKFNYEHPEKLAHSIIESVLKRKKISVPFQTKIKLCLNTLFPSLAKKLIQRFKAP